MTQSTENFFQEMRAAQELANNRKQQQSIDQAIKAQYTRKKTDEFPLGILVIGILIGIILVLLKDKFNGLRKDRFPDQNSPEKSRVTKPTPSRSLSA